MAKDKECLLNNFPDEFFQSLDDKMTRRSEFLRIEKNNEHIACCTAFLNLFQRGPAKLLTHNVNAKMQNLPPSLSLSKYLDCPVQILAVIAEQISEIYATIIFIFIHPINNHASAPDNRFYRLECPACDRLTSGVCC